MNAPRYNQEQGYQDFGQEGYESNRRYGRESYPIDPGYGRGYPYKRGCGCFHKHPPYWGGQGRDRGAHRQGRYLGHGTNMGAGRGPKNYRRSDERILEDIGELIIDLGLDASDVEIQINQGEVTLLGTVDNRFARNSQNEAVKCPFTMVSALVETKE